MENSGPSTTYVSIKSLSWWILKLQTKLNVYSLKAEF